MFFDWVEGFVAHLVAYVIGGLDRGLYVSEWENYGNVKCLGKARLCGSEAVTLIKLILDAFKVDNVGEVKRNEALKETGE